MNEIYEIIGILSYTTEPHVSFDPSDHFQGFSTQYPSNLIPRVHCLTLKKISSIDFELEALNNIKAKYQNKIFDMEYSKDQFIGLLNKITGDELVSYYLLIGLLNNLNENINKKEDYLENIKKLVINVYKCSKNQFIQNNTISYSFVEILTKLFEKILLKSLYFPIEIDSLEKTKFFSTKNYQNNCLDIGKFQISPSTVVILDETKMSPGNLTEKGLKNLQNLNEFLDNQTLTFDFSFHDVILIISLIFYLKIS